MLFLGLFWRVWGVPPQGSGAPNWQIPGTRIGDSRGLAGPHARLGMPLSGASKRTGGTPRVPWDAWQDHARLGLEEWRDPRALGCLRPHARLGMQGLWGLFRGLSEAGAPHGAMPPTPRRQGAGTFWAVREGNPANFLQKKPHISASKACPRSRPRQKPRKVAKPCVTCLLVLGPTPRGPCEEVSLFCPAALPCPVLWLLPALNRATRQGARGEVFVGWGVNPKPKLRIVGVVGAGLH